MNKGTQILTHDQVVDKKVLEYLKRARSILLNSGKYNWLPYENESYLTQIEDIEIAKMIQREEPLIVEVKIKEKK